MKTLDNFPLSWPETWPRTMGHQRTYSKFKTSFSRARDELFRELGLLGVRNNFVSTVIVLSTNVPLRQDGLPYAGQANPKDPGVAVYFKLKDKDMVFACDKFLKVEENLWAVVKTIEALRGIKRWGASDMMERAFTGFQALPAPEQRKPWWEVLGVSRSADIGFIKDIYRSLSLKHHPDRGGDQSMMQKVNAAWEEAQRERGI